MDWTAFAIAALGIGGTLMSPLIAHYLEGLRQKSAHDREDKAILRQKLEETYSELDRLQGQANASSIAILRLLNSGENIPEQPPFDISRVRVNVGLYFPECVGPFEEYDRETEAAVKKMRADFAGDPVNAMASYTLMSFALYGAMATKMRKLLNERAAAISMAVKQPTKKRPQPPAVAKG